MSEPPVLVDPPRAAPLNPTSYSDDERSLLDHFGLPFFYRHTPPPAMRKGLFWLTFLGLGIVLFINFLFMPHSAGSIARTIKESVFGYGGHYRDAVQGCASIFNQFFTSALILSGIVGPAFATFSLSSERVSGTMESLRLSPMSTTAIILGKIFASAYWIHLISALLIGLGICFGIVGDLGLANISLAVLGIVLGCATLHAVGAYFAVFTVAARGFGAVIGLLSVGFVLSMLPMAGWEERGFEFFSFLSPWGCMDGLFWHGMSGNWRYNNVPQFFGLTGAIKFYVLAFHTLTFSLLIWAASRKLETPERSALPKMGWCVVWGFVLFTAVGMLWNDYRNVNLRGYNYNWLYAGLVLIFGFLGTCVLVLLDHPFDRDTVLAEECERVAGRENRKPPLRMVHAIYTAALTAISAATILFFFHMGGSLTGQAVPISLAVCSAVVLLAFLISLALETSTIGYLSAWSRTATAMIAVAILLAAMFSPLIHLSAAYSRWQQAMWMGNSLYPNPELSDAQKKKQQYWDDNWIRRQPYIQLYLGGVNSWDDLQDRRREYENQPLKLFVAYHSTATVIYPLVFFTAIGALFLWRRRKYAALTREAEASIARADAMAPVIEKPVLAESAVVS